MLFLGDLLLRGLYAFYTEHERCGELEGGVEGEWASPFNICVVVATPNLDTVSQRNCRQEPDTRMTVMCRRFSCSSSKIDVERAGI